MKPSPDPLGQASLMLWEGLVLLLIEKGVVNKDDAVTVVIGVTEIVQGLVRTQNKAKANLELVRILRAIAGSLSAAN